MKTMFFGLEFRLFSFEFQANIKAGGKTGVLLVYENYMKFYCLVLLFWGQRIIKLFFNYLFISSRGHLLKHIDIMTLNN